jgi:hypothetical protein
MELACKVTVCRHFKYVFPLMYFTGLGFDIPWNKALFSEYSVASEVLVKGIRSLSI